MSNHVLHPSFVDELKTYEGWHLIASSSGMKRKSLQIEIRGTRFRVVYGDKIVYCGRSAIKAVKVYNESIA